jgi:cysteine synthase/biotin carboxylase
MRHESVVDAIGHTPLIRLAIDAPPGVEVYAKLELQNLFAMKDRVARQVILDARRSGALAPGAPIVESSSGTMALGLALVGTYLGHPVHIVTDPRIDPITLAKLETLGCEVHVVSAMTGQGWQSARLELLDTLLDGLPGAFWPRQYTNPRNPYAYRTLAAELLEDTRTVDVLVGSVGSGGSLCGTAKALLESLPDLRVVAIDCVGSVLFAQPDVPKRRQSGLGNSLYPTNIDYRLIDEVHWLSDDEAFEATRRLAREQKIFGGNTSGSVYRVLTHLAAQAEPGTRLVGIMPDRGDRYIESVYRAEPTAPISVEPEPVEYGAAVASWSFARVPRRGRPALLFVESNTTGSGMIALRTAVRLALEPVLLCKDQARYAGLTETGCLVVECDTDDLEALETAAKDAAAGRIVCGVTTTSEYYLEQSAGLARRFGLQANPPATVAVCRSKPATRAALSASGLLQPRYAVVTDIETAADAVAAVGLPVVVKPVGESGSHRVLWCADEETAVAHTAELLAVDRNVRGQKIAPAALIEEFIDGPEYSVELFCDGRKSISLGITQRTHTPLPHFVETSHLFPAQLPAEEGDRVTAVARAALRSVGFRQGPAHVEVKMTARGPVVIEVNGRLAGGMIPELIRLAFGVDLVDQQIRAAGGLPLRLDRDRSRLAGLRFLTAACAGVFSDITGLARARRVPGVAQVTLTVTPGRPVRPPRDAYDRLGFVIAVGDTPDEIEASLNAAMTLIEIHVQKD